MAEKKTKYKVFICDDEAERYAKGWAANLKATLKQVKAPFEAEYLEKGELTDCIRELAWRQRKTVKKSVQVPTNTEIPFDTAEVLIVDYRLEDLDNEAGFVTGEEVARLARIHSTCGIIIVLNEPPYGDGRFDLTFKGYPGSFADLHLSSRLVDDPGLWTDAHLTEYRFRPWTWPHIPTALEKWKKRCAEMEKHITEDIYEYFDLKDERDLLPLEVRLFLEQKKNSKNWSFEDFANHSSQAKRSAKDHYPPDARIRVAASRIHHWLERLVLPLQDTIIDAPHLALRYPSLVKKDGWNEIAGTTDKAKAGWMSAAMKKVVEPHRFQKENWLNRPAWFHRPLRENNNIAEVADPIHAETAPHVFCEDISRFIHPDRAQWVSADIPSPNRMRWVIDRANLHDKSFENVQKTLREKKIKYEPAVKLAE